MTCERFNLIHAYHDGELSPAAREEAESHLAACEACRQLLDELRGLSAMLASADLPQVPRSAMNRMQGAWWASRPAQEHGIRRLSAWLTAAAAAVLVIVPLTPRSASVEQPIVATRSWEIMALVPPAGPREDPNAELIQAAQWIAGDLSTEQSQ
jgi:anti-sigma factor RsiW